MDPSVVVARSWSMALMLIEMEREGWAAPASMESNDATDDEQPAQHVPLFPPTASSASSTIARVMATAGTADTNRFIYAAHTSEAAYHETQGDLPNAVAALRQVRTPPTRPCPLNLSTHGMRAHSTFLCVKIHAHTSHRNSGRDLVRRAAGRPIP